MEEILMIAQVAIVLITDIKLDIIVYVIQDITIVALRIAYTVIIHGFYLFKIIFFAKV